MMIAFPAVDAETQHKEKKAAYTSDLYTTKTQVISLESANK